jgi:hypothetical protein
MAWRRRLLGALTAGVAVACFVAGGAALWLWFDPARLAETTPWRLLGLLGLFVLPAATIAFQAIDRRDRSRANADTDSSRVAHPSPRVRRHPQGRRPSPAPTRSRSVR